MQDTGRAERNPPEVFDNRSRPKGLGPKRRYLALDGYRAIAACLVVLYHYNRNFQLGIERWLGSVDRLYLLVDFFFVLSGFVVMTSYASRVGSGREIATFLRRRLARIYPLHALTLSAFVAVAVAAYAVGANNQEDFAPSALPANVFLLQAWGVTSHDSFNVPAWSISAEWLAYLVFPALVIATQRWSAGVNLVLIAGFVAIFILAREQAGLRAWTIATYDFGALRALPTFFAGMLMANAIPKIEHGRFGGQAAWPSVHALFLANLALLETGVPDEICIATFVIVVGGAALAERDGGQTRLAKPFAQRLGAASYAIYMLHVLAGIPVILILRRTVGLGTVPAAIAAAVTFAAVLIVADLVHRRFEVPWQRRLSSTPDPSRDLRR